MAGTIGLSLTQRIDKDSLKPLAGGKLYFIQAGTPAAPQNAFQDIGLANAWPNPLPLDAGGNVPQLFFADGFIKFRLTNKSGVEQLVQDFIQVVGPSSGTGVAPSVDATTIFQTGDTLWLDVQGIRTGWVRDNGRTIGNASSGATERANSDTSALFAFLWGRTDCPISGGIGANAAADFAANKTLTLPDKRGYVPGGLDDMGNSAAGRYVNVPVVSGAVTTAGSILGEATHTLLLAESPSHNHAVTDPGHTHSVSNISLGAAVATPGSNTYTNSSSVTTQSSMTGISLAAAGSDGAHNNVQKTVLGSFFRKL